LKIDMIVVILNTVGKSMYKLLKYMLTLVL